MTFEGIKTALGIKVCLIFHSLLVKFQAVGMYQ
jgi:hypothetical protein